MKIANGKYEVLETPNVSAYITDVQRARWERWISALEQGVFEQTTQGYLKTTDNCYCVIGTGLELFKDELKGKWENVYANGWLFKIDGEDGDFITTAPCALAPLLLTDYSDLSSIDSIAFLFTVTVRRTYGRTSPNPRQLGLAALSDVGTSFAEVASIMRLATTTGYKLELQ